jgi:putative nucleotidyltransferase with HDIG domain
VANAPSVADSLTLTDTVDSVRQLVAARTGRDGYPDDHAIAVARCALQVSEQLELPPETRAAVLTGALLHDVGKLFVDAEILEQPRALTADERRQVEKHPLCGHDIISTAVDPAVAEVVRDHHERWDGSGYPHGLAGEEISVAARVVAVADAFLAMLEDRPYRRPRSATAAVRELRACSGTQFDPACVEGLTCALTGL